MPYQLASAGFRLLGLAVCVVASASQAAEPALWSLRPLQRSPVPVVADPWIRNALDAFILQSLQQKGITPSPQADRRTLIRRAYFDLLGLLPSVTDIEAFESDPRPDAFEQLVDRLLASPRYGERWARHWLDVVHYADTHGYDKDKPRPNAWPYRDYVIRALNEDKPYSRFVQEQIAGDVLYPGTRDGIEATGFIAAGPWDFIGHVEVPESKIDGQVARNLDRDDMVVNSLNTFSSFTVQCARCHDHKFDPITMRDYYRLQAVFAALDRADRAYDVSPEVGHRRSQFQESQRKAEARNKELQAEVDRVGGTKLKVLSERVAAAEKRQAQQPAFGYHSQISSSPDELKWVQVDLGQSLHIERVRYAGCHDDFNGIGDGFGFPVSYRIEVSDDPTFQEGATLLEERSDAPNPGVRPQIVPGRGQRGRYVRVTATELAPRQNDYIFALAELEVLGTGGTNAALGRPVIALDSIEAPVRWQKANLVDGYFPGQAAPDELAALRTERDEWIRQTIAPEVRDELAALKVRLEQLQTDLGKLPPPNLVYAGMVYRGSGAFSGSGGKPREISILRRGDVTSPAEVVGPGALGIVPGAESVFPTTDEEGSRRAALANWLVHPEHPLTWRSIVNRVWQYHFGAGLVATPNDFGVMGTPPTHPELLDWLALEFRDSGQSLKQLHRLLMTSATYRQVSAARAEAAAVDGDNKFLWRMNRRRLEAEPVRDLMLCLAGQMDWRMYGPGFQDFIIEKPEHSPHYQYHLYDPDDPRAHRRAVYRFIVRSQQQPLMTTLDCADPSQLVARRTESTTPLQALALLNNRLIIRMCDHFARRLAAEHRDLDVQVENAFAEALGRKPKRMELDSLIALARSQGLPAVCRVIVNLNEFVFID